MSCNSPTAIGPQFLRILTFGFILTLSQLAFGESLQTLSFPVNKGTIKVVNGNSDRADWQSVPAYDEDAPDDASPNNYLSVQVANDADFLFFRFLLEESDAYGFRHNLYLDTDQDRETGFIGTGADGFLSAGADYLVQGGSVFRFSGPAQNEWGWTFLEDIAWDATKPLDVETAVRRTAIGNPAAFDFFMNAANFDLGTPEDFYPDTAALPAGDFYTYEVGNIATVGIDELTAAIRSGTTNNRFDLNRDGKIDGADRVHWVEVLNRTYFGDANLDGQFNTGDFITVFQAGEYEDTIAGNSRWGTGDWDGDGDFTSSDFVAAFQGAGFEQGPRAAVASVPEPGSAAWIAFGLIGLRFRRRIRN